MISGSTDYRACHTNPTSLLYHVVQITGCVIQIRHHHYIRQHRFQGVSYKSDIIIISGSTDSRACHTNHTSLLYHVVQITRCVIQIRHHYYLRLADYRGCHTNQTSLLYQVVQITGGLKQIRHHYYLRQYRLQGLSYKSDIIIISGSTDYRGS